MTDHADLTAKRALALAKYPVLSGDYQAGSAVADQIETGMALPRQLVDTWVEALPHPQTREQIRALLAEDDYGDDKTGERRYRYADSLGFIADRAIKAYRREFGSSHLDPATHLVGFTVETDWPVSPNTVDMRAYAIMARWPFERRPILTAADLASFFAEAKRFKMCDVGRKGTYCDGAIWTESNLIPLVRDDVIVLIAICHDCSKRYRKRRDISHGEIIEP